MITKKPKRAYAWIAGLAWPPSKLCVIINICLLRWALGLYGSQNNNTLTACHSL
jgi:hypothetical protein